MTMAVTFAMNCAVWMTFGTTCSVRASDEYSWLPAPLPNMPKDSATTMRPRPPSRCIMKRNVLSA